MPIEPYESIIFKIDNKVLDYISFELIGNNKHYFLAKIKYYKKNDKKDILIDKKNEPIILRKTFNIEKIIVEFGKYLIELSELNGSSS